MFLITVSKSFQVYSCVFNSQVICVRVTLTDAYPRLFQRFLLALYAVVYMLFD